MDGVRSAASLEGLIIFGAIYFFLNLMAKAGKKKEAPRTDGEILRAGATEEDTGLSLQKVLREIQRAKERAEAEQTAARAARPAAQPRGERVRQPRPERAPRSKLNAEERGPLGRHSLTRLPAAEEVEDRTSLESGSREVALRIQNLDNRTRDVVDLDDEAEEAVQRRLAWAAARNREHRAVDHQGFDAKIREPAAADPVVRRFSPSQMRDAFVWREILGPPRSLEE